MIGKKHQITICLLLVTGLVSTGAVLSDTVPRAEASVACAVRTGSLTAYDVEQSACIYISGDLPKWLFSGTAPDEFRNDSLVKNACLYPGSFYTGIPVMVPRGAEVTVPNFRGSIRWTTEATCPV